VGQDIREHMRQFIIGFVIRHLTLLCQFRQNLQEPLAVRRFA
jgi:hypothetical protein